MEEQKGITQAADKNSRVASILSSLPEKKGPSFAQKQKQAKPRRRQTRATNKTPVNKQVKTMRQAKPPRKKQTIKTGGNAPIMPIPAANCPSFLWAVWGKSVKI